MADSRKITIHLGFNADLAGAAKAKQSLKGLGEAAGKLGSVFGGANALLGDFFRNLTKGSVWMMGASAIGFAYKKTVELMKAADEAARESERTMADALGACAKGLDAYKVAVDEAAKASREAADAGLKARQTELDLTDRLTKATVELARQRRIANGEDAAKVNEETDAAVRGQSAQTARAKADAEVEAARRRIEIAENEAEEARLEERRIRDARATMTENDWVYYGSPELEKKHRKLLRSADKKAEEARQVGNRADERAAAERKNLEDAIARRNALEQELEAADLKAANERAAQDRAEAEARRAAEVKAAQDAARERDRLDRELHQKRMADLREEIAEQQKAASPLRAAAAAAQGEFERAFGMYRDPTRAAAEIAEEKSRAEDLDRLHRDASRYGGKWRIDELSRLMATGDAQGQADALASWRKSSRFTPEVEAMVRASAAEQTKTTAEDELRKIEANTAGLAKKLDNLISMKGGD